MERKRNIWCGWWKHYGYQDFNYFWLSDYRSKLGCHSYNKRSSCLAWFSLHEAYTGWIEETLEQTLRRAETIISFKKLFFSFYLHTVSVERPRHEQNGWSEDTLTDTAVMREYWRLSQTSGRRNNERIKWSRAGQTELGMRIRNKFPRWLRKRRAISHFCCANDDYEPFHHERTVRPCYCLASTCNL